MFIDLIGLLTRIGVFLIVGGGALLITELLAEMTAEVFVAIFDPTETTVKDDSIKIAALSLMIAGVILTFGSLLLR